MEETRVRVKGQCKYLYRAVDKDGDTIDFLLRGPSGHGDSVSLFRESIDQNGLPETVTIDGSTANLAALEAINAELETPIKVRQTKNLNNIVDQGRRTIRRRTQPMLRFKDFRCARIIPSSIEVNGMNASHP